jgi:saccharopine dehydrogenase (NAD+, L-lysine-forming)
MSQCTILILGGYGNAGLAIARLLARWGSCKVILAGRNGRKAQQAAECLNAECVGDCFSGQEVDAASRSSLLAAFAQANIVVVAAATIASTALVAEAAPEANIDYFDIQISTPAKRRALESLQEQVRAARRCFITDGGYRPGLPAAMVRYAACQIPALASAQVSSVFQVNWKEREFSSSSATEFVDELRYFDQSHYHDGAWTQGSMRDLTPVDFGAPFGVKYCMPMYMEEFRSLPAIIPTLQSTGFFSAGFGGWMDYLVIPTALGMLAAFRNRSDKAVGRLLVWGMKYTTHPPYGAVLKLHAQGSGETLEMTVAHVDPYFLTAAAAVACLLQYVDGGFGEPGLFRQGTLVEPIRFFDDLARMGVSVKRSLA